MPNNINGASPLAKVFKDFVHAQNHKTRPKPRNLSEKLFIQTCFTLGPEYFKSSPKKKTF